MSQFVNRRWLIGTVAAACVVSAPAAFAPTAEANPVFITVDPGPAGGPADFEAGGTFAANDEGVLDVFVVFAPKTIVAPPDFTYSSSYSWEVENTDVRIREWVGNFLMDPPPTPLMITDSDDDDSPVEFSADGLSAAVTDRTFPAFPFPVERYHTEISGLAAGEMVTFRKLGFGGTVVPEPASCWLLLSGGLGLTTIALRRRVASMRA